MASYNKCTLIGNLTRDPELRTLPKGTAICQFGIAINRKYKTEAGEMKEEVTFVDLEAWGKTAELIAKYLKKGSLALFDGRLKLDTWEDKETKQKRQKLKVVVETMQFLDRKPEGTAPATAAPAPASEAPSEDIPY